MTARERTQAAARVITAHRPYTAQSSRSGFCRCETPFMAKAWTPLHVAEALDEAGLLCALREVTS